MKKLIHKHQQHEWHQYNYQKQHDQNERFQFHNRKNHGHHIYLLRVVFGLTPSIFLLVLVFIFFSADTSALTYQNTIPQTFTINDTLSISLSSSDLRIDELIPGQSSDSNTITVTVYSNNAYGYNLSANTGNTTYNTTNLVGANNNNFSSLDPTASIDTPSSFNDNTWGFNYCDYNNNASCNNNWNTYSGLPIYSAGANKELKNTETVSAATGDKLDFKIAARASTDQAGGEYNNVVNFVAVGYTEPQSIYMQDLDKVQTEIAKLQSGEDLEVKDKRDNKTYTVAKMPDGNIWMNQNLDLELSSSTPLTSEDTDLDTSGSGAYSSGYEKDPTTNVISWTPASTATTSNVSISGTSVTGWTNSNTAPYSAEGGDVYVYTSGNTDKDTVYNSLDACKADHTEAECKHYHRGNYYNWTAAIASNASSGISSDGSTAANSVCPKGWRLPKGNENGSTYEFGTVLLNAGVISSIPGVDSGASYVNNGFNKIRSTPLYLVRSGTIYSSTLGTSASYGHYWSSTVYSSDYAYYLRFYGSYVYPRYNYGARNYGFPVRCLAPPGPIGNMQDVNSWKGELSVGEEVTARDSRDGKEYKVAKLADNNIWLLDNLAFDPTASGTTMSESDTNAPAAAINVFLNGGTAAQDGWTSSKVTNGSISSYTAPQIQNGYINTIPSDATSQVGKYKIGVYYNYCAASAGTYCYASGSGTGNASYDICPAGWRMPTGNTGEYYTLYNNFNYNTYAKYRAALHLPLSGYYGNSSAYGQGSDGYFWSSTRNDGYYMYDLILSTSSVNLQSSNTRLYGYSVRCVAQ